MASAVKSLAQLRAWYARNERPIGTLSLVGGFIFNVFTLTRVDQFWENFWVAMHLLVVAVCIILINREENEGAKSIIKRAANPEKIHFWLATVLQFTFGGLLSTFIVFYFRSAVLAVTWPFFLILIAAFVANESLKKHYATLSFQIGFLFLSIYLFAIFLVPVLLHQISQGIFLLSGGLSVLALVLFLLVLRRFTNEGFKKGKAILFSTVTAIYIAVNALYFLDLIPPLPLSLQDAGIYHSITRTGSEYTVTTEPGSFWSRMLEYVYVYPTYHTSAENRVYAYSSIFSPVSFTTKTVHEWQKYDETHKKWTTEATINLTVSGARQEGYRTYSINTNLTTGKWRVNVKTSTGQLIGRMAFAVVIQDTEPTLETAIKE